MIFCLFMVSEVSDNNLKVEVFLDLEKGKQRIEGELELSRTGTSLGGKGRSK
uniref:Uncharacterized protein n=1 Tax=Rhizophora mucronata TaxID=61149 RepID=A0A2P2QYR0_RHIMU